MKIIYSSIASDLSTRRNHWRMRFSMADSWEGKLSFHLSIRHLDSLKSVTQLNSHDIFNELELCDMLKCVAHMKICMKYTIFLIRAILSFDIYPFRCVVAPVRLLRLLSRLFSKQPLVVPLRLARSLTHYRNRSLTFAAVNGINGKQLGFVCPQEDEEQLSGSYLLWNQLLDRN